MASSIDWPLTLGQKVDRGGRETPPATTIRTQMDKGPDEVRQRGVAGTRDASNPLSCTAAQIGILDGFYVTTLRGGSLSFNWVIPRTDVAAELRFVSPPVYRDLGGDRWVADLALEVLP